MSQTARYIISVMSVDRVGIIHDITDCILALQGNIEELSQTVMRGYFTVLFEATFPAEVTAGDVKAKLEAGGREPGELQGLIMPREIEVPEVAKRKDTYILTARGPDKPGTIHRIASFLAGHDINYEDLYCYIEGEQFIMSAQLTLPPTLPFERLQIDLEMVGREADIEIVLQHENIFRAVNDVRMVDS